MRKAKYWLLSLFILTNLSINAYALCYPKDSQIVLKQLSVKAEVNVTSNPIQYSNEYITVKLDIPVISGIENSEVQKKINDKIQNTIMATKDSIEKMAIEDGELNKKTGYDVRQYNVTSQYDITYIEGNILSVVLTIYQYTGGAHGSSNKIAYNFDLNTGNYGVLNDFFGNNLSYRSIILDKIKSEMIKEPGKYFSDSIKNLNGIPYNQNFYMDKDGVIVYFGEYEIAPYASGIPEFKIPYSALPKGLNKNVKIIDSPLEITNETLIQGEQGFQSYLSYPVIKLNNSMVINNINKMIKDQVFDFNSFIKTKAMEEQNKINSDKQLKEWGASTYFKSYYVNKDLLSIAITYSASNGTTENYVLYNKGYNVNLNSGEVYKLKDVFKKNYNYIEPINKEIKDQIKTLEKNLGHGNIYNFTTVDENTDFYIEKGNLIITFPQGKIASKEYYNPEFIIPLSKFKDNVNNLFLEK